MPSLSFLLNKTDGLLADTSIGAQFVVYEMIVFFLDEYFMASVEH